MSNAKECTVEQYLIDRVKALDGFTVKLSPINAVGVQDRLVVLHDAIFVMELKRPKGGVTAQLQHWWRQRFTERGHASYICKTKAEIDKVLDGYAKPGLYEKL